MSIEVSANLARMEWEFRLAGMPAQWMDVPALLKELPAESSELRYLNDGFAVPLTLSAIREFGTLLMKRDYAVEGTAEAKRILTFLRDLEKKGVTFDDLPKADGLPEAFYLHQRLTVAYCLARDHAGLKLDMGLGKTWALLEVVRKRAGSVLVVAPRTILEVVWEKETRAHLPEFVPLVASGSSEAKTEAMETALQLSKERQRVLLATNYETLLSHERLLTRLFHNGFEHLVLDESHWIKNHNAQRSRAAWRLGRHAKHRYLLTGTLVTQSVEDVFSQFRFLDESVFGRWNAQKKRWESRIADFRDRYLQIEMKCYRGNWVREAVGEKNLSELREKIASRCVEFTKAECLDLPEKTYQTRRIEMTVEQRRVYESLVEEMMAVLSSEEGGQFIEVNSVLPLLSKLRQVTSGFVLRNGEAFRFRQNPKLDELFDLVSELMATHHKVVVYGTFREEMDWISERLRRFGVVTMDGRTPDKERRELIERFQTDERIRVFVGQTATAGLGITLTAADTAIYFSNDYSYANREQSEARIHRIGQEQPCLYVDLTARESIDESIVDILKRKGSLAGRITRSRWERLLKGERDV